PTPYKIFMSSHWLDYARLVRLPNVFTAAADILLAALIVGLPRVGWSLPLLLIVSACLYSAGMVFNDVFDAKRDLRERPFRPIPSGRISLFTAFQLGVVLMVIAGIAAFFADKVSQYWAGQAFVFAELIGLAVLAYDIWLKNTWAGPVGMGLCRFL